MKKQNVNHISNLTDDVLCALVARHQVRQLGQTPGSTNKFLEVFHEFSDSPKNFSEKQEKARKLKLNQYVRTHLALKDEHGEPTDMIDTD